MLKKKIVVAGAGVLDVLVQPAKRAVFETGSLPVEQIKIATGGDALNEATLLSRLGKEVYFLSVLGKDEAGDTLWNHCVKEGVNTELVMRDPALSTSVNVVLVEEDGNRSFYTASQTTLRKLEPAHFPERFPEDAGIFSMASIFVSPMLNTDDYETIFKQAKSQGMIVCADTTRCKNGETPKDMAAAFKLIDYLFLNESEAAELTRKESVSDMAEEIFACGVKHVIIKCGGAGCYVKSADLAQQFPAVPGTRCVDTTGAGDSFAAGFICALAEEKTLEECIRWANACGSLTTEAVGACAGVWNREQVLERVKRILNQSV